MRIKLKIAVSTGIAVGLLALTACGNSQPTTATVNNPETENLPGAQATATGTPLFTIGGGKAGGDSGRNSNF